MLIVYGRGLSDVITGLGFFGTDARNLRGLSTWRASMSAITIGTS
jgi:hypothetical protein